VQWQLCVPPAVTSRKSSFCTHTHTHTYIYIYTLCVCLCVCVSHNAGNKQRCWSSLWTAVRQSTEPLQFIYRNISQRGFNTCCAIFEFTFSSLTRYSVIFEQYNPRGYKNNGTFVFEGMIQEAECRNPRVTASIGLLSATSVDAFSTFHQTTDPVPVTETSCCLWDTRRSAKSRTPWDKVTLGRGFFEYLGFLLSVSLDQCSILIYLSLTLCNVSN
jgi:hypothetical protein